MFNKSIISFLTILIILSSCARSPKEITLNETNERVEKDILKIEQIKKENETWEDNIKIDLYTAIALAIKNNKELKIKQLETGIAYRQLDKVEFEMLPAIAVYKSILILSSQDSFSFLICSIFKISFSTLSLDSFKLISFGLRAHEDSMIRIVKSEIIDLLNICLLYTSPSPRDS